MAKRRRRHARPCADWLVAVRIRVRPALHRAWRRFRSRRRVVPVEVLITDRVRRRALERELRRGLAGLERAIGTPLPDGLGIVVQHAITTDRQLAGCCHLGQHSDGSRMSLVRLALQVKGRRLTTDELLAVLAEQCVTALTQHTASVLFPIELEPAVAEPRRPRLLRTDPLMPSPNGTAAANRIG